MFHVRSLPSYIRDTTNHLKHIEGIQIHPDALLMAIDIEAFYSSIPHKQCVRMAGSFLREQEQSSWPLNQFILRVLYFILTKNYFIIIDQLYLQTQGVAMGTSCTPAYANLYLGGWERHITSDDRYKHFLEHVL